MAKPINALFSSLLVAMGLVPLFAQDSLVSTEAASAAQQPSIGLGTVVKKLNIPFNHPKYHEGWHDAMVVLGVAPGSPAEQSGLKVGDVLIAFNGTYLSERAEILEQLIKMKENAPLDIKIMRKGKVIDLQLQMGKYALDKLKKMRLTQVTKDAMLSSRKSQSAEERAASQLNQQKAQSPVSLSTEERELIRNAVNRIKGELKKGSRDCNAAMISQNLQLIHDALKNLRQQAPHLITEQSAEASVQFKHQSHIIRIQLINKSLILEIYDPKGALIEQSKISTVAERQALKERSRQLLRSL